MSILPDATTWTAFMNPTYRNFVEQDARAAVAYSSTRLVGFDRPAQREDARVAEPPPFSSFDYFLCRVLLPFTQCVPDLDRIRRNAAPVITAAGLASADAYYARTACIQARILDCRYVELAGHHLAFQTEAEALTAVLRDALGLLSVFCSR